MVNTELVVLLKSSRGYTKRKLAGANKNKKQQGGSHLIKGPCQEFVTEGSPTRDSEKVWNKAMCPLLSVDSQ